MIENSTVKCRMPFLSARQDLIQLRPGVSIVVQLRVRLKSSNKVDVHCGFLACGSADRPVRHSHPTLGILCLGHDRINHYK